MIFLPPLADKLRPRVNSPFGFASWSLSPTVLRCGQKHIDKKHVGKNIVCKPKTAKYFEDNKSIVRESRTRERWPVVWPEPRFLDSTQPNKRELRKRERWPVEQLSHIEKHRVKRSWRGNTTPRVREHLYIFRPLFGLLTFLCFLMHTCFRVTLACRQVWRART